ncbi:hypothetical protein ACCO45_013223 [Purpureocillium lilacinum]|uniref:Uncharacterized protein n=1 Tax=Purpureocillium lilacinum TaxID=33203 RepID=A0ACC4DA86_PURLI
MCIHGQGPILTISQNHAVTTIHSTETFDGQNNARPDTWNGRRPPCATHGLHRNLHPPPSASQRATLPAGNQIAGSETRRRLNQQRGNRPPARAAVEHRSAPGGQWRQAMRAVPSSHVSARTRAIAWGPVGRRDNGP